MIAAAVQRAPKSAPCFAKPSKAYSSYSVIKGDKMKSHDAEKLDVEVKLKVEHLTLVAWDRSVATRLYPHESSSASQTKFLALIGREVAPILQL